MKRVQLIDCRDNGCGTDGVQLVSPGGIRGGYTIDHRVLRDYL